MLTDGAVAASADVQATVSSRVVQTIPDGFLGVSMSDVEMPTYARAPGIAPMLDQLHPFGRSLSLRVGGQTADNAVWNGTQSLVNPLYLFPSEFVITPTWMQTLASLTTATHAHVILGLNATVHSPRAGAALAGAAHGVLGAALTGLSIGNEPDLYAGGLVGTHKDPPNEQWLYSYTAAKYAREFGAYRPAVRAAAPGVALLGPETANPSVSWDKALLRSHAGVDQLTTHSYSMISCVAPTNPRYPTIARFLSDTRVRQWATRIRTLAGYAHDHGRRFRITEFGSSACGGLPGVSESFATGLWGLNQLFALAAAGVDGVNVHIRPGGLNSALTLTSTDALQAMPLFYGLATFARAVGPHARLLQVTAPASNHLSEWAVRSTLGLRVVLTNTGDRATTVSLRMPSSGAVTDQALSARSPSAPQATLAGQTLGAGGEWIGARSRHTPEERAGRWRVAVPAHTAVLVVAR